ncbi:class E sortase [Streptomyces diastatochromogenes]|uniref:Class E sortase n=1 Tax=Streptomyces diastatochromogenes TaxID=42236 RepID=A0A233SBT2_STRDA|nr:class E sortase [Streptomyces diastatochromogenes]MCZ0988116.1 class E sortase [Streptomyces diastatochromogenes]OXY93094.1 class E sortase [Streptomyces diastatochromogenes]
MRVIVRTVSELCITVGTLIVLFVVYVLFWTGVQADGVMSDQIDQLHQQWSKGSVQPAAGSTGASAGAARPAAYHYGKPFAIMYIPRLGSTWNKPVLEGTGTDVLKKGLAHYAGTARLGERGNFAVAGHRRTYGDPFKDFPRLRPGDAVVLTDGSTWFTYRIDKGPYKTVPTDVEVIDPVPRKSGYTRPGRYLTLTTCDPEWGHSHRLIVWAHLDSTQPVESGEPRALRR